MKLNQVKEQEKRLLTSSIIGNEKDHSTVTANRISLSLPNKTSSSSKRDSGSCSDQSE
eukprot:Pgem_evm1s17238